MAQWNAIRLGDARQVADLAGTDETLLPEPGISAPAYYQHFRDTGQAVAALDFIGHALPRFEAIAWAAKILDAESRRRPLAPRDRQALDCALRWLGEPGDAARRAAYHAAVAAGERSPERMLGFAVYFSGGSISLPDLQPVLPPPEAAGRFAVGAIKQAAYRTEDPELLVELALMMAEAVAESGLKALAAE